MRRRAILYALLALAVPLPALALAGGGDSGPAKLSVSASIDSCGTADATIVCKIDASWNAVPGADRYTASVTRADGSVVDFGDVAGAGSSFWVPYAGNGTYTVNVSAYGAPPGETKPRVVARGSAGTGSKASASTTGGEAAGGSAADPPVGSLTGGDPADEGSGDEGSGAGEPATPEPPAKPTCEEPPVKEPPAEDVPVDEGDSVTEPKSEAGTPEALSAEAQAVLDASAELPGDADCAEATTAP